MPQSLWKTAAGSFVDCRFFRRRNTVRVVTTKVACAVVMLTGFTCFLGCSSVDDRPGDGSKAPTGLAASQFRSRTIELNVTEVVKHSDVVANPKPPPPFKTLVYYTFKFNPDDRENPCTVTPTTGESDELTYVDAHTGRWCTNSLDHKTNEVARVRVSNLRRYVGVSK
jgi:hypothetical protein